MMTPRPTQIATVLRAALAADTLARTMHRARTAWFRSLGVSDLAARIYEARRAAWGDEPCPWSVLAPATHDALKADARAALAGSREGVSDWDALTPDARRAYRQRAEDLVCQGRRLPLGMSPRDFFQGRRVVTGLHRPDHVIGAIEPEENKEPS